MIAGKIRMTMSSVEEGHVLVVVHRSILCAIS